MKGFMKTCGILAILFIIIGFVLTIACSSFIGVSTVEETVNKVSGGKFHLNLDWKNWGLTIGEKIRNKDMFEVKYYDIDKNPQGDLFHKGHDIMKGNIDKYQVAAGDVKGLSLEIGGSSLQIRESKDDNFWLEASKIDGLQCFTENDVLFVVGSKNGKINIGFGMDSEVILYVPKDYRFTKAVNIELGAGEVEGEDFAAAEMNIKVGAGNVELKNVATDDLNCEVGAGNVDFKGAINNGASLECAMGNLSLKLDGKEKDYDYEIQCAMGNIDLNGTEYVGLAKEKSIKNGTGKLIEASCSMGNIEIDF